MLKLITLFLALAVPQLYAQGLPGATPPRVLDPAAPLSVILLGTGIPLPNPVRATACAAVIAGDRVFLVDTGRNCIVPFAAAGLRAIEGIFYTHYHSDHFIGLGELWLNAAIGGIDTAVTVHGPVGAQQVVDGITATYELDLNYRVGPAYTPPLYSCDTQRLAREWQAAHPSEP